MNNLDATCATWAGFLFRRPLFEYVVQRASSTAKRSNMEALFINMKEACMMLMPAFVLVCYDDVLRRPRVSEKVKEFEMGRFRGCALFWVA